MSYRVNPKTSKIDLGCPILPVSVRTMLPPATISGERQSKNKVKPS